MTRAILRQTVREAYLTADRVVRMAAEEIAGLIARWQDWGPVGVTRLMLQIRVRIRSIWLAWMSHALRAHLNQVQNRTLDLVADVPLRARIARTTPAPRPAVMWRLDRQVGWVVATVERIVRAVTSVPNVESVAIAGVVAGSVARFLHPRFAQVRYRQSGSVQRRYVSSGAYAGTYARQLFREETSRAYGETMQAIAAGDPGVIGERWRLATAHAPGTDECDRKANADMFGMGKGVYSPGQFPEYPSHRGCLCSRELVRSSARTVTDG